MKVSNKIRKIMGGGRRFLIFLKIRFGNRVVYSRLLHLLKNNNVRKVHAIKTSLKWYGEQHFCFYFKGIIDGEKKFIKIGNNYQCKNEFNIVPYISKIESPFILYPTQILKKDDVYAVAYPYFKSKRISNDIPFPLFKQLCIEMENVLISLNNAGICHCDMNLNNVLRTGNNHFLITDFGVSFYENQTHKYVDYKNIKWINYKKVDNYLYFDNFVDIVEMLKQKKFPEHYYKCIEFKHLENHVGDKKFLVII